MHYRLIVLALIMSTTAKAQHHRCGWMNDNFTLGTQSLVNNSDYYDAVHPYFWYLLTDGTLKRTASSDDSAILSAARTHGIKLMPMISGGSTAVGMRAVMGSPGSINAHVAALMSIVTASGYDGLDLDYEHLWAATDRPRYVQLISQLATALHAKGKELSLSVPAIDVDPGTSAYDYAALVNAGADAIHLMGYDYHYLGGPHLGPLAPLGWVTAVATRVQSLGIAGRFLLGVANYGIGATWYANGLEAANSCTAGSYSNTTTHMATCTFGHPAAGLSPHCSTANGPVWFEDASSIGEKARMARDHGLRGVAYYTLGGETAGMLQAILAAFP